MLLCYITTPLIIVSSVEKIVFVLLRGLISLDPSASLHPPSEFSPRVEKTESSGKGKSIQGKFQAWPRCLVWGGDTA